VLFLLTIPAFFTLLAVYMWTTITTITFQRLGF
jgi:hypothetical protein